MAPWQSSRVSSWSWPSSHSSYQPPKDEWAQWKCGHCATLNWQHYGSQKKKCRTCGLKKSYKDAAMPTHTTTSSTQRNGVSAKLEEVAAQLQSVARKEKEDQPMAPAQPTEGVDRKAISEEIAGLEVALANIADSAEFEAVKSSLQAKIEEKKKSIVRSKPIGMQVDSCQKFVARCQARRDQAEQGVVLAQQALTNSQQALAEAEAALCSAQAELKDRQEEMAQEMAQQGPATSQDSMKGLTASLEKVIHDMKSGGKVSDQHIGEAKQHMDKLMDGLNAIRAVVQSQAAAVSCSGGPGATGISTPVEDDVDIPGDAPKRSGDVDQNGAAARRRLDVKAEGAPQFVAPDTPARTDGEAALMQAFPPPQGHPSPG